MTEHVEGDPCKFALWVGRTPTSDNKIVLKVSKISLLSSVFFTLSCLPKNLRSWIVKMNMSSYYSVYLHIWATRFSVCRGVNCHALFFQTHMESINSHPESQRLVFESVVTSVYKKKETEDEHKH